MTGNAAKRGGTTRGVIAGLFIEAAAVVIWQVAKALGSAVAWILIGR